MSKVTEKKIKNALLRLKYGRPIIVPKNRKMSISALAEEAGVSDSTIHNRYPQIALEVRLLLGKEHKVQRDLKDEKLKAEIAKNRDLKLYIERLESEHRMLASINARLIEENIQLNVDLKKATVNF